MKLGRQLDGNEAARRVEWRELMAARFKFSFAFNKQKTKSGAANQFNYLLILGSAGLSFNSLSLLAHSFAAQPIETDTEVSIPAAFILFSNYFF